MMGLAKMDDVKISAYLLIPYLLWLTFAAYLNIGTIILN
jgi:tryptophan-rich sensory protein